MSQDTQDNSDGQFTVGDHYDPEELPDNEMNQSGKVENVGTDLFALALPDGRMVEFKLALKCTAVYKMEDGEITDIIEGDPCPLGRNGQN
jgi:hypothetical protein